MTEPAIKLNEWTKDEWQDIAQAAKPGLSQAEYDGMWVRFVAFKQARLARLALN